MTTKTNIKRNGNYRFTSDGLFAIEPVIPLDKNYLPQFQSDSIYLYIQQDKANSIINETSALSNLIKNKFIILDTLEPIKNLSMKLSGLDVTNTYKKFIFHRPLIDKREYDPINKKPIGKWTSTNENDCLKFGECMTIANQTGDKRLFNETIQKYEGPSVLEVKSVKKSVKQKNFGEDEELNIKLVNQIEDSKKNNNAVPENGESYAIVRKEGIVGFADYHIAFVLYTHQNINITLDASADAGHEYYPRFAFYDINPSGLTFHKMFVEHYTNGETIVLKNRNIDVVLKEIDEENAKSSVNNSKRRKIGSGKKRSSKKKSKNRKTIKKY